MTKHQSLDAARAAAATFVTEDFLEAYLENFDRIVRSDFFTEGDILEGNAFARFVLTATAEAFAPRTPEGKEALRKLLLHFQKR